MIEPRSVGVVIFKGMRSTGIDQSRPEGLGPLKVAHPNRTAGKLVRGRELEKRPRKG